jgi:CheY-like chemotaxis protein
VKPNECHIIIVDDEPDLAEILAESLELEDFKVSRFLSAEEALKALKGHDDFHVVISDAHMPGMNGLDFLVTLKKDFRHQFLFYLCTGDLEVTEEDLKNRGGSALICKPYNLFDLVDTIKEAVAHVG